jgi:predicted  nucleic acid-binding Zn-ribbon protein
MEVKDEVKYKELLVEREIVKKRLEHINDVLMEEKDNEESWPGHASNRYQAAENDRYVLVEQLESIEEELKRLKRGILHD